MTIEKRIYYHDTDAGGVVYYGNYLKFLEESRTAFMEDRGISVREKDEEGFLYAVRQCNVTYKSPARYGDTVVCTAEIVKITAAQLYFKQKVLKKDDNTLLIEADVTLVSLTKDFKPTPIPDNIKEKLAKKL